MRGLTNPNDLDSSGDPIQSYIEFFTGLSQPSQIFDSFREAVPNRTPLEAKVVGALWYHLSEAIVDLLCVALAKLKTPHIRHLVAQTVYEELGEASPDDIHTDLLRRMLLLAGVDDTAVLRWSGHAGINQAIDSLKADLEACTSDAEICGLLLGMELIAYENVDNVIDYLSYSEEVGGAVRDTPWARLHYQLEEGHIRRAVGIFVTHMGDLPNQRRFVRTFMRTIRFWNDFWSEIARETVTARSAGLGQG